MIRFLRQNAEIITSVCVVLSLIIGGSFLYRSHQAQAAGQAELDAITVSESAKASSAPRTPAAAPAASVPNAPVAGSPDSRVAPASAPAEPPQN